MLFIKWILLIFTQLIAEEINYFTTADILASSSVSNLNINEQNFTFPNKTVPHSDKNNIENNENEYQHKIRSEQQINNGFLNSLSIKNYNEPSRIKIHCCKINNSIVECQYGTYKCIIKLNNNILNQDEVNGLVRSIYTFIDTLTNNNHATVAMIPSPIFSNLGNSGRLDKYMGDSKKLDFNKLYSSIDEKHEILRSKNYDESYNLKNIHKNDDQNKQNRIIECSLDSNEDRINSFRKEITPKKEILLKLTCQLTGNDLLQPEFFIIPFTKSNIKKIFETYNANNKVYLKSLQTTAVYNELDNSHEVKKRNCKTHHRPMIKKTQVFDNNEINSNENIETENENNKINVQNKYIDNINYDNDNMDVDFAGSNSGTMETKLNVVKAWMKNFKEKSLNMKKQQYDEDISDTQPQFLFYTKHGILARIENIPAQTKILAMNDKTTKKAISKNTDAINTKNGKHTDESNDFFQKQQYDNDQEERKTGSKMTTKHKNFQKKHRKSSISFLSGLSFFEPKYSNTGKISNKWTEKQSSTDKTNKHRYKQTSVSSSLSNYSLNDFRSEIVTDDTVYDEDDDDDDDQEAMNGIISYFNTHTTDIDRKYKYNNNPNAYMITNEIDKIKKANEQSKLNNRSSSLSFLKKMFNIPKLNSKNGVIRNYNNRKTTSQLNKNQENLVKYQVNDEIRDNYQTVVMETPDYSEDNKQNNKTLNNSYEMNNHYLSEKIKFKEDCDRCLDLFKEDENHRKRLFDFINNVKIKRLHKLKHQNLWKNNLLQSHKNFNVRNNRGK